MHLAQHVEGGERLDGSHRAEELRGVLAGAQTVVAHAAAEPLLPRLMVPFAQADASTTRRYGTCFSFELAKIPVVALTASAMPEDLKRCRLAGMNECLTKPIAYDALAEMLTRFEAALPA